MKKYSRVYVEITNICNKSCSFCPGTKRKATTVSPEQFNILTEKLVGITDYIYLHVMGEPLMHPYLEELISIAVSRGFKCAITTNGTLLPDMAQMLAKSGLYKLSISVHSLEDGDTGEYDKYVGDCAEAADLLSRSGILTVMRLWNRGFDRGRNVDIVNILKRHFPDGEWLESPRGIRIRDKLHIEYGDRFAWPDIAIDDISDCVFCYGLKDHFGILADGTVVPCCLDRDGEIALGNAYRQDIVEILSSERAIAIAQGFANRRAVEPLCKKCGYARRFG